MDSMYVAIAAPRAHGKSTAVTQSYTLASALFRESDNIVILSDTDFQAIQFLGDIKMELTENEQIIQLFQINDVLDKDSEKEIIVTTGKDKKPFRIVARGASGGTGKVRGFKWRGKRPNLIICDDAENDEAVMNEERREKFRNWFMNALIPALSDSGRLRVIGTILHFDSMLERLMPPTTGDGAKLTKSNAIMDWSEDQTRIWKSVKFRSHPEFDDFSEILWPEKFSEKRLRDIRQSYIDQGNASGYSQEYLNYPISADTAYFRRSDFIPMTEDDKKADGKRLFNYYISSDFAISQKDRRAFTVFVVAGMDERGMLHIVHVVRERMDSKQIMDEMWALQKRYNPEVFVIEQGALKDALGPFLYDEMLRSGVSINFMPMTPVIDKVRRAGSIIGRMRMGGVKFDKEADWFPSLEEELLRFDRGPYKDQVDAMAWLGLVLNQLASAPTQEERDDEEYEDEFSEHDMAGRSRVTGY